MAVATLPAATIADEPGAVVSPEYLACREQIRGALHGTCELGDALVDMEMISPEAAAWWSRRLAKAQDGASNHDPGCSFL